MSTFLKLCFGVIVMLSFAACGSTEKTGNDDSDNNNGPSISNEGLDQQAGPGLAPGTAKIRIEIQRAEKGDESHTWQSAVKEVLGYGSATPPLSVGTEVSISVGSYFSNADTDPEEVMDRDQIICIIRHEQTMDSSPSDGWSLVDIVDQSKN